MRLRVPFRPRRLELASLEKTRFAERCGAVLRVLTVATRRLKKKTKLGGDGVNFLDAASAAR